ncbi:mRNA-decapping enzyme subunit 2 [Phtheirospermum japonicum]|uniref:mRNA-decapping enzyme subunit 2 n=1 Tax=Phtheirospermum japonicum TaxID=374723 RepID=A0A830D5R1_9LAMI|nr:mRNA-decapping enzyme subunit 2 [Phtheirospermum japonicum]
MARSSSSVTQLQRSCLSRSLAPSNSIVFFFSCASSLRLASFKKPVFLFLLKTVLEDTGFDVSSLLNKHDHIEMIFGQQRVRLYIIAGVKDDTYFAPQTKKEISFGYHLSYTLSKIPDDVRAEIPPCFIEKPVSNKDGKKEEEISRATLIWRAAKLPMYIVAVIPTTPKSTSRAMKVIGVVQATCEGIRVGNEHGCSPITVIQEPVLESILFSTPVFSLFFETFWKVYFPECLFLETFFPERLFLETFWKVYFPECLLFETFWKVYFSERAKSNASAGCSRLSDFPEQLHTERLSRAFWICKNRRSGKLFLH